MCRLCLRDNPSIKSLEGLHTESSQKVAIIVKDYSGEYPCIGYINKCKYSLGRSECNSIDEYIMMTIYRTHILRKLNKEYKPHNVRKLLDDTVITKVGEYAKKFRIKENVGTNISKEINTSSGSICYRVTPAGAKSKTFHSLAEATIYSYSTRPAKKKHGARSICIEKHIYQVTAHETKRVTFKVRTYIEKVEVSKSFSTIKEARKYLKEVINGK